MTNNAQVQYQSVDRIYTINLKARIKVSIMPMVNVILRFSKLRVTKAVSILDIRNIFRQN